MKEKLKKIKIPTSLKEMNLLQFGKASEVISKDHTKLELLKVFIEEIDLNQFNFDQINKVYDVLFHAFTQGAEFQPLIKINGQTYVFEPDLKNINFGAYADIKTFQEAGLFENLHNISAILYRKGGKKFGQYEIESYTSLGNRPQEFSAHMTADIVAGMLVFFSSLIKSFIISSRDYSLPK